MSGAMAGSIQQALLDARDQDGQMDPVVARILGIEVSP